MIVKSVMKSRVITGIFLLLLISLMSFISSTCFGTLLTEENKTNITYPNESNIELISTRSKLE